MSHGTSKTRVAFSLIARPLALNTGGVKVIVFPSLAQLIQFDHDSAEIYATLEEEGIKHICVCSWRGDRPSTDEEKAHRETYITNKILLTKTLKRIAGNGFVVVTHQGLEMLAPALESTKVIPSLVIFDKTHRALREGNEVVLGKLSAKCTVFMTVNKGEGGSEQGSGSGSVPFRYTYNQGMMYDRPSEVVEVVQYTC